MKINLFYIIIGVIVVAGGWFFYRFYFLSTPAVSPATALTASIGISSGAIGTSTDTSIGSSTSDPSAFSSPAAASPSLAASAVAAPSSAAKAPTAPSGLTVMTSTDTMVVLSWGASYDVAGVAGYKIFMNGKEVGTASAQKFEAQGLKASTTYTFTVSAYDQNGGVSPLSPPLSVTTKPPQPAAPVSATSTSSSTSSSSIDTIVPSVPSGLSAVAVSDSEIDLSWSPSTDNVGVTGYRIFSNSAFIATSSGAFYKSTGLAAGSGYSYTVAAYDAAGNVSAQSTSASATTNTDTSTQQNSNTNTTATADTTPPTTSITSPSANATVSGTITVSATASDDVGVVKVELYADSVLQTADTSLPYVFTLNTATLTNGTHSLSTKAYDAAGNVGTSPAVSVTVNNAAANNATTTTNTTTTTSVATTTTSATQPAAPTSLIATAISSTEVDLSWTAPASGGGSITGYRIFRDGHPFDVSTGANTTYSDTTQVVAGTTYSYTIAAYSSTLANTGPQSASASATTP